MKYLLHAAFVGSALWILTECMEIASGIEHSSLSLWITMFWHPLLAAGFWGLHKSQSPQKNPLSLVGVLIMIYSLLLIAPGALVILYSPVESFSKLLAHDHFFKFLGIVFLAGLLTFGIAINRSKYYPRYVGIVFIAVVLFIFFQSFLSFSDKLLHLTFIILNFIILRMVVYAMNHREEMVSYA